MPFSSVSIDPIKTDKFPQTPVVPPLRDDARVKNIVLTPDYANPITKDAQGNVLPAPLYRVQYAGVIEVGHWNSDNTWSPGETINDGVPDILSGEIVSEFPDIATMTPKIISIVVGLAQKAGKI